LNKKILAAVFIIMSVALVIPGCASTDATTPTSQTATTAPSTNTGTGTRTDAGPGTGNANTTTVSGYSVKVKKGGTTLATFSVADLDKLAAVSIKADGKDYAGPSILSILSQAGASDFRKVTIVGFTKGRLATAELPVTKANLNNNYVLRKTNQNTFSLASPDVQADSWIIDVEELRVE
jgi:hypothetical protein